jgi:hypothetical protein
MKTQPFALAIALTWLLFAQTTMAQAQGTEDVDSARAAVRFQRAVELYREGSYEGALAEFTRAYQISPSYLVLYNIAQAQYALHDFVGAYKSLMQYISEGSGQIPADRRIQVDEMTAKLVGRIAHLQITTNVSGADIRIDDVGAGTSPLPGPVAVNVGTHKVSAARVGSPEAVRMVSVAGKEIVKVDLQINLPTVASAKLASSTVSPSASLTATPQAQSASSRTGLIVSLSTTAALAVGTGVCGYFALRAQKDLDDQMKIYPNTRNKIEDARTKSKNYGHLTDALGAATLISGGIALYLVLTHSDNAPTPRSGQTKKHVVLAPTLGGMVLEGSF